jgi:hypothetical protein
MLGSTKIHLSHLQWELVVWWTNSGGNVKIVCRSLSKSNCQCQSKAREKLEKCNIIHVSSNFFMSLSSV